MGCRFCMTAKGGWVRNLSAGEIISQVRDVQQRVASRRHAPDQHRFHGHGRAVGQLPECGPGPGGDYRRRLRPQNLDRRVTVSTAGLVPGMADLGRDTRVNLAVSLNAADDDTRTRLMPINRKYPIADLIAACRRYPLPPRRKITFEYILMKGVNDSMADAQRLVKLLRPFKAKINLIPFNEHPGSEFKRPEADRDQPVPGVAGRSPLHRHRAPQQGPGHRCRLRSTARKIEGRDLKTEGKERKPIAVGLVNVPLETYRLACSAGAWIGMPPWLKTGGF
jgi:hypothetical protein